MIKNTAKNGLPMRFEIRECVLGLAMVFGFEKDEKIEKLLYPGNEHRQKQCVLLRIPCNITKLSKEMNYLNKAIMVIKRYYHYFVQDGEYVFYDTKKFRIYYKRMTWGREKKVILDNVVQYLRTLLVTTMISEYMNNINLVEDKKESSKNMWFVREAKNIDESEALLSSAREKPDTQINNYCEVVLKKKKTRRIRIDG